MWGLENIFNDNKAQIPDKVTESEESQNLA